MSDIDKELWEIWRGKKHHPNSRIMFGESGREPEYYNAAVCCPLCKSLGIGVVEKG